LQASISGHLDFTPALARLAKVSSLAQLRAWWLTDARPVLGDDCAVVGEADRDAGAPRVLNILLHECLLHGDVNEMIGKCSRLVATWGLMEQPCELDLGSCDCVGADTEPQGPTLHRRFLVHATARHSALVFVLISAVRWADASEQKHLLGIIVDPLAHACNRTTERAWSLPEGGAARRPALTPREHQIVCALRQGMTNKEIARALGLSPNTVRNQISRLSAKVGARSRAQLALLGDAPPPHRDTAAADWGFSNE